MMNWQWFLRQQQWLKPRTKKNHEKSLVEIQTGHLPKACSQRHRYSQLPGNYMQQSHSREGLDRNGMRRSDVYTNAVGNPGGSNRFESK
jgi:hypothetical protein